MNINAKFLAEAKELEAKWSDLGLLADGKFTRNVTASMLECQRLHNETGTWDCCDECREREKADDIKTFSRSDKKTMIELGNHRDVPDKDSFYIGCVH
jgi:hypothetical protein